MSTMAFDTLKFVEHLKKSGIPELQAKAIATAFKEANMDAETVSKNDLRELEYRLIIKFGVMLSFASGLIVTLGKLL